MPEGLPMGIAKVQEKELRVAVETSFTMAEMFRKVGIQFGGGSYSTAKRRIESLGLDTSHWLGQAVGRGKRRPNKEIKPLSDILVEGSSYSRRSLKLRLIREGILEERCAVCQLSNWQGKPITLQLDHINGVNDDHRRENLRLLCPNCHSQTDTFSGRNLREEPDPCPDCGGPKGYQSVRCQPCSVIARYGKPVERTIQAPAGTRTYRSCSPSHSELTCPSCRGVKSKKATLCKTCSNRSKGMAYQKKANWPSVEDLLEELRGSNFSAVGRRLGISDNAVRKHLRVRLGEDWKSHL